jgi:glycosyltransferase involved in cell wall biosynthesis
MQIGLVGGARKVVTPVKPSMRLSILICSLEERQASLQRLVNRLQVQRKPNVEILVEVDNRKITIGEKRNILLKKATGDYIAFVDDDDLVSEDYTQKILAGVKTSPDCIGIVGIVEFQQKHIQRYFIHTIQCKTWYEKDGVYYRCPNHLSPVKRELALKVMFPHKSVGEDMDYSLRLRPLLKTEVMIDGVIYYYLTN